MSSTAKRTNAERKNKEMKEFVLTDVTSSREEKRMTEESNMITLFTLIMLVFTCAAKNLISVLLRLFVSSLLPKQYKDEELTYLCIR